MFEVITNAAAVPGLSPRFISRLEEMSSLIFDLIAEVDTVPVEQLIDDVMHKTGYLEELQAERTPQSESRAENLQELISVAQDFLKDAGEEKTLARFLEHVALVSDILPRAWSSRWCFWPGWKKDCSPIPAVSWTMNRWRKNVGSVMWALPAPSRYCI